MSDSLGDRMKLYENVSNYVLPIRIPLIIRLDGKSFHTITRHLERPFDQMFVKLMLDTALYCCKELQGAQLAYVQSDEISILIHNYKTLKTELPFSNRIQKIVSISAALASVQFNSLLRNLDNSKTKRMQGAVFDSRAFILPEAELCNYFLWRQQDATRNSINSLAQSLYSHKQLSKKNNSQLQEMCFEKGKNWNDLPTILKRGACIVRNGEWKIDEEIPIFSQNRNYVDNHLICND